MSTAADTKEGGRSADCPSPFGARSFRLPGASASFQPKAKADAPKPEFSTRARRRFEVPLPQPSEDSRRAFLAFYAALRKRTWRDAERLVFGAGGSHGSVELGGLAAVLGGWSDAEARAWLSERPRQLAGVSVGVLGAVGLALGIGPLRLAAMNYLFPYADIFGSDVLIGSRRGVSASEVLSQLSTLRGLLGGVSLRTIAHTVLVEAGCDDDLTFAQLRARTGHGVRIVATSLDRMELVVFSAESTPHVAVADAMVASMTIPGLIAPHRIPGLGSFVDGGVLDPFGLRAFEDLPAAPTLWLCKAPNLDPARRSDSLMSVLLACMNSSATDGLKRAWPPGGDPLRFLALVPGARHNCDERDVGSSVNLFAKPDVTSMLCDGMECVEAAALAAWMLLCLAVQKADP
jgi:predicted acylesterase/phospholipase RssA